MSEITAIRPARVNPLLQHGQEQRLSLDGAWHFRLDPDDRGVAERWFSSTNPLLEEILVPGCWQGQGFGGDGEDRLWDFNLEARVFRATYKGTGWYGRIFRVPAEWVGQRVWLNFGGAHPSAEVWVNGERVGASDLPFVPFAFDITERIRPGADNLLAVRIHEHHREFGFAYNWQGNWSGLYRGVELSATGPCWLERCAVLPDADAGAIRLRAAFGGAIGLDARLAVSATLVDGSRPACRAEFPVSAEAGEYALPVAYPLLWSPDAPNLYRVEIELLLGGQVSDARSERTGFVKLEGAGQAFRINGEPYYLRGSGDFISCPETGCPDTDRKRWRRKLRALRDYGYNYVRCQSYVYGPEYYDIADEVGLLVQSEMGMIGGWGGSSPWHVYQWPKPTADNYPILKRQWDLVVERDACHPSANLYCMSNECGRNTDFPRLAWACYRDTKAIKPTALVIWTDGGYNKELPGDFINHNAEAFKPEELAALDKPLIEHEFKWWSSFPDVRLRDKYTGAIRPYAAEIAAAAAAHRGQAHLLETYAANSQRLQFLEAKGKMEMLRRDRPTLAGICHFDAMDANPSPQGVITEFYERKLADAATWRETNGDTVVLSSLGFDDRCLTAGGRFTVRFSVSDFSHPSWRAARLVWRLRAGDRTLAEGGHEVAITSFTTAAAGEADMAIPALETPVAATLEVELSETGGGRVARNRWSLWLFPETALPEGVAVYGEPRWTWLKQWAGLPRVPAGAAAAKPRVLLTEALDEPLLDHLRQGGRVLLAAGEGLVRPHHPLFGYVKYFFTPPANYAPYEDGQNGTVIAAHPLLGGFPHEGFADLQFFRMIDNAPPLDLEPLGLADAEPVIRTIHRYPVLRPLGYLVERRVGSGGLLVNSLEFNQAWIESRWLLAALCRHLASDAWRPAAELSAASAARLQGVPAHG